MKRFCSTKKDTKSNIPKKNVFSIIFEGKKLATAVVQQWRQFNDFVVNVFKTTSYFRSTGEKSDKKSFKLFGKSSSFDNFLMGSIESSGN